MIRILTSHLPQRFPFFPASLLPLRQALFPRFLSARHHDPSRELPNQPTAQPEASHLKEDLKLSLWVSRGEWERAEASKDARLLRLEAIVEGLQSDAEDSDEDFTDGEEEEEEEGQEETGEDDAEESAPRKKPDRLLQLAEALEACDPTVPGDFERCNRDVNNILSGPYSEEQQADFKLISVRLLISAARANKARVDALDDGSPARAAEQETYSRLESQLEGLLGRPFEDVDPDDPILNATLADALKLLTYRLNSRYDARRVSQRSPR